MTLAYQVNQILIVEPDEIEALEIDPNEDYCTLVTCTPYGQNTHRLLVRGQRIDLSTSTSTSSGSTVDLPTYTPDPMDGFPIFSIIVIGTVVFGGILGIVLYRKRQKHK